MAIKNKSLLPVSVNAADLGLIFDISARRVQQLVNESVFEKKARGKYVVKGSGKAYADYLSQSEIDRRDGGTPRQDVDFERARKLRLENDRLENTLINTNLSISAIDLIMGVLQSELAGLPAHASEDVIVRRKVEDGIERVLEAITGRCREAGEALRSGRDPFDTSEENDV